tara:strand:- start:246888 stop:247421 length:534 start_codon:yes stop_codon:yes gene_type:complete
MFELFKKRKHSPKPTKTLRYKNWTEFTQNPHHQWIINDKYLLRSFQFFFELLDQRANIFLSKNKINFIHTNGSFACGLTKTNQSYNIILFKEVVKFFYSANPDVGIAILAHELGHFVHDHSQKFENGTIDSKMAQLEADQFAIDLGLIDPLETFLRDFSKHPDVTYRLRNIEIIRSK